MNQSENTFVLGNHTYIAAVFSPTDEVQHKCYLCDCRHYNLCHEAPECSTGRRVDKRNVIFKRIK